MSVELTLLSRSYCHLCHDMEVALAPILDTLGATVRVLDVDEHPPLLEKYDELVPVLLLGDQEICHYFLDHARVREVLGQIR